MRFAVFCVLLSVFCPLLAVDDQDTVVVIENPGQVIFEDVENTIRIDIQGKSEDPLYRFSYVKQIRPGITDTLVVRERSDWDFTLPFQKFTRKHRRYRGFDGHWAGLGFGMCHALGTTTGGRNGSGVNTTMGSSYEIFWNIFSIDYAPWRNGWGLVSGIGIDWRNFRMTGHSRFVKEDGELYISNYPEGADIEFSRIKVFSVTIPALLEWQSQTKCFFVNAGAIFNFNTYASLKTRYKLDGEKVKEFHKNIHQTPFTVDFTVMGGWDNLAAYFKYSPMRVLQTEYAPQFNAISVGAVWLF